MRTSDWSSDVCASDLDDAIRDIGGADDLDLDLGHHVGGVFGAAIDFGLALLAAEPLDLGDGHARDPEIGERFADVVALERLDDGGDEFHARAPVVVRRRFAKHRTTSWEERRVGQEWGGPGRSGWSPA